MFISFDRSLEELVLTSLSMRDINASLYLIMSLTVSNLRSSYLYEHVPVSTKMAILLRTLELHAVLLYITETSPYKSYPRISRNEQLSHNTHSD